MDALRHREAIFPPVSRRTSACHASTVAETREGLVAAWFGGPYEGHPEVAIWLSRREDGAWSEPRKVASGREADGTRVACWNPVLFAMPAGPLLLFHKQGRLIPTWRSVLQASHDEGRSWSEPHTLADARHGPVKNKPLLTGDGTLVCPTSDEAEGWGVYFSLSADGGRTWSVNGPHNDVHGMRAIQPTLLRHPGGRLQALCRTDRGRVGVTWSEDRGRSWSPLELMDLDASNTGLDAVTLEDGRHLLVRNPVPEHGDARRILTVAISNDGLAWTRAVVLEEEDHGEFSYPAVIQTRDGLVHVTYTHDRTTIHHAVLDPAALPAPA